MRILAALTVAFFSFSSVAAVNVKAGDTVQEDGVFLTKEEAAKIIADKRVLVEQCDEKVSHAKALTKAEEQLKIRNLETDLKAEKDKNETISAIKDREIDRLYKQIQDEGGEYDEYILIGGVLVGVITTAAITTAIFFAAVQTSKSDSLITP